MIVFLTQIRCLFHIIVQVLFQTIFRALRLQRGLWILRASKVIEEYIFYETSIVLLVCNFLEEELDDLFLELLVLFIVIFSFKFLDFVFIEVWITKRRSNFGLFHLVGNFFEFERNVKQGITEIGVFHAFNNTFHLFDVFDTCLRL